MRSMYILFLALHSLAEETFSDTEVYQQTEWSRPNVEDGEADRTEGVGAFLDLPLEPGTRNLDVGGGAHDFITNYLKGRGIINLVYDPYARSQTHNRNVMKAVIDDPVDSVTSISVLNVIDDPTARFRHISLCRHSLKLGGRAFFKVWPGNGSGIGEYIPGGFQSNRDLKSYIEEVIHVFATDYVLYDPQVDVLIAYKGNV